jgi:hypothetical protein
VLHTVARRLTNVAKSALLQGIAHRLLLLSIMPTNVLGDITNIVVHGRAPVAAVAANIGRGGARNHGGQRKQRRHSLDAYAQQARAISVVAAAHRRKLQEHIDALTNPRGRSLTANELRIIIRIAVWLQLHEHIPQAEAIEKASVGAGSSATTITAAYQHYIDTNEILEPDTSFRGTGSPRHRRHDSALSFEQLLTIHRVLGEAKLANEFMPAREVQRRVGFSLGVRQTQRILKLLGYIWGRKRCIGTASKQQTAQRTRSYMRQYADALYQQSTGQAVIVYTDESYIHTTHSKQYVWYHKSSIDHNHVNALPSKGKRLILLHAMTEQGLLCDAGADGAIAMAPQVLSKSFLSCELIKEGLVDSEDYTRT